MEELDIFCDDRCLYGASYLSSSCLNVLVVCADSFSEITTRTVWPHRGKSRTDLSLQGRPPFFNSEFSVSFELSSRQEGKYSLARARKYQNARTMDFSSTPEMYCCTIGGQRAWTLITVRVWGAEVGRTGSTWLLVYSGSLCRQSAVSATIRDAGFAFTLRVCNLGALGGIWCPTYICCTQLGSLTTSVYIITGYWCIALPACPSHQNGLPFLSGTGCRHLVGVENQQALSGGVMPAPHNPQPTSRLRVSKRVGRLVFVVIPSAEPPLLGRQLVAVVHSTSHVNRAWRVQEQSVLGVSCQDVAKTQRQQQQEVGSRCS